MDATKGIGECSYSNQDGSDSPREEMLPKSKKPRRKWSDDEEDLLLAVCNLSILFYFIFFLF